MRVNFNIKIFSKLWFSNNADLYVQYFLGRLNVLIIYIFCLHGQRNTFVCLSYSENFPQHLFALS